MKRQLTDQEFTDSGMVVPFHERMENGERRFRLMHQDGSGYIRTVAGEVGAWQNSHYHTSAIEVYVVQSGWIGFVWQDAYRATYRRIYQAGESFTVQPSIRHNVYVPAHTVFHTIKIKAGEIVANDWHAAPDLDQLTKPLSEAHILQTFASN